MKGFDKLNEHKDFEIYSELVWENIGPEILAEINRRKRKRKVLFYMSFGTLIVSILAFTILYLNSPSSIECDKIKKSINQNTIANVPLKNISKIENIEIINIDSVEREAKAYFKFNADKAITDKAITDKTIADKTITDKIIADKAIADKTITDRTTTDKTLSDKNIESRNQIKLNRPIYNQTTIENDLFNISTNSTASSGSIENRIIDSDDKSNSYNESPSLVYTFLNIPLLEKLPTGGLSVLPPMNILDKLQIVKKMESSYTPWMIQGYVGINNFNSDYLFGNGENRFRNHESPLFGYDIVVRVGKEIRQNISIHTGIEFSNYRYVFRAKFTESISVAKEETLKQIIINQVTADTTFQYAQSTYINRTTRTQHYNSHSIVKVPMLASYKLGTKKIGLHLLAGVKLQLLRISRGKTSFEMPNIININDHPDYKSSIRILGSLGLQCHYIVMPRASIFINASVDRQLDENQFNMFSIKQSLMFSNLGVGMQLHF